MCTVVYKYYLKQVGWNMLNVLFNSFTLIIKKIFLVKISNFKELSQMYQ